MKGWSWGMERERRNGNVRRTMGWNSVAIFFFLFFFFEKRCLSMFFFFIIYFYWNGVLKKWKKERIRREINKLVRIFFTQIQPSYRLFTTIWLVVHNLLPLTWSISMTTWQQLLTVWMAECFTADMLDT
jgi:hypothetical protein